MLDNEEYNWHLFNVLSLLIGSVSEQLVPMSAKGEKSNIVIIWFENQFFTF